MPLLNKFDTCYGKTEPDNPNIILRSVQPIFI